MDFLKTLLAYMAATFVVAVESTSTPSVTPVPTPAPATDSPVAAVEMITAMPSEEITATPTISVTPVPVPTITPNMKGYHNLLQGDRGEEVRKLQERLIELGYLPEGSADGAFGGRTRNAVRRFQYYNGLTVDGIAGRTTQTNLFENPDVAPMPTEEPSSTPAAVSVSTPTTDSANGSEKELAGHKPVEEKPNMQENSGETEEEGRREAASDVSSEPTDMPTPTDTPEATNTPIPTDTPEPTNTPIPTVTPYVVATPTEIPWGDVSKELAAENAEDTVTEMGSEEESEESISPDKTNDGAGEQKAEEIAVRSEDEMSGTNKPEDTEIVEEVNLDESEAGDAPKPVEEPGQTEYYDLAGWIVLNDSDKALQWTEQEDGVTAVRSPRMEKADDDIRISLDDMVQSVENWVLHDEGDSVILEAQGFTLALLNEETGFAAALDGLEMAADPVDFSFEEGHFIRVDFLTKALDGTWEWDEEEETLKLQIPEKGIDLSAE